jgi:hypothetical protein
MTKDELAEAAVTLLEIPDHVIVESEDVAGTEELDMIRVLRKHDRVT